MTATLTRFTERTVLRGRVDREAGIIRGVRILGPRSKNGRRYTPEAIQEAAPLYEGSKVYSNHQRKSEAGEDRGWGEWVGNLKNVRYESGGLVGDLKLRKASASFEEICEAAESDDFNKSFGLSHEADGDSRFDRSEGVEIVTRIAEVQGVAIVDRPATTSGLFESLAEVPDYIGPNEVAPVPQCRKAHAITQEMLKLLEKYPGTPFAPMADTIAGVADTLKEILQQHDAAPLEMEIHESFRRLINSR